MRIFTKINGGLGQVGCGFLDDGELGLFLEGRLEAARVAAFAGHRGEGCSECAMMAADAMAFRNVVENGVLPGEQRDFDRTQAILKAELRQKLETMDAGRAGSSRWFRWAPAVGAAAAALLLAIVAVPRIGGPGTGADGAIELADGRTLALQPFAYSEQVVTRNSNGTAALWREVGDAYAAGRYADAVAPLRELIEHHPESIDAHLYLGNALLMDERLVEAARAFERAEDLAGRGSAATFGLAQALLGLGDRSGAVAALEATIEAEGLMAGDAARLLGEIAADRSPAF